jgi:hypothetical protein
MALLSVVIRINKTTYALLHLYHIWARFTVAKIQDIGSPNNNCSPSVCCSWFEPKSRIHRGSGRWKKGTEPILSRSDFRMRIRGNGPRRKSGIQFRKCKGDSDSGGQISVV